MTRSQIQSLYFRRDGELASVQVACRRLRILAERGYLARTRLPAIRGSGPYVYQPGKGAMGLLDKDERALIGRGSSRRRIDSLAGLAHGLETVDFYIALKEALESRGGRILAWLGDSQARHRFAWQGQRLPFTPDAYSLWALGSEEGAFFLEWDRGTEGMNRFSQKLTRYQAYYQARAYQDHLGLTGLRPRLLIVVPDERRETAVVGWIARRLARHEFAALPTLLVGSRDVVLHDVLGPIWRRPGQEGRVRLVD